MNITVRRTESPRRCPLITLHRQAAPDVRSRADDQARPPHLLTERREHDGHRSEAVREAQQFIGGEWVDAAGGATFEDRDPFTGEVVAHRPGRRRARTRAARSRRPRRRSPPGRRRRRPSGSAIFLKAADILESRRDEVVVAARARDRLRRSASACSRCTSSRASSARRRRSPYAPIGQVIPSDTRARSRWASASPVGVVGAIAPWNAALILSARSIAAPLALGNTVVLKPSEWSPVVGGLIWGEIFAEAGLPDGVLNIVTHAPGEAGADRRRARREPGRAPDQLHRLDRNAAAGSPRPRAAT